ncbi:protein NO VEIN domain-containing protein [Actinoplanes ianthinogenes]|uniref:protein NO VEIN domain-containing protein n=1 Tax=Actinoplanes ianthinogenes TaxID=122358 RepID=UPI00166F9574|nr:DUF3883 domain-containing protein [Actinoplanes ianthinogenes]
MSDDVLAVWSSSSPNGSRNFEYGIRTRTWGFKSFEPDYRSSVRWVLFGYSHSSGGPRQPAADWQSGVADILLCEVSGDFYTGHAPHWPDEIEDNKIIYPCRIGITVIGAATGVSTSANGPLGLAGSEALRLSGTGNRGVYCRVDLSDLRQVLDAPVTSSGVVDLSRTAGDVIPERPNRRSQGQGRSQDAALNKALEDHAVAMAIEHYRGLGWDEIRTLGKPYDLVCTKVTGEEKHVEVKGTTGAGGDVNYTPNEVQHFRSCPFGADLVVVRDIQVDRSVFPHATSGGELLHVENYQAPPEDLKATGWTGRVSGWH